jgi:hypothetical protein
MKSLWAQTLAWLAAAVVAFLLALASPDGPHIPPDLPHGATTPR